MSLQVYNGFRMPLTSVHELQAWAQTVRVRAHEVHDRLFLRWVAETATSVVDSVAMAASVEEAKEGVGLLLHERVASMTSPVGGQAVWSCRTRENEYARSATREVYDLEANLVIFPIRDHLLAWLFAERPEYGRALRRVPGVERYDYWDNTDAPRGMTQGAWEQRGEDWRMALGAGPTPAQAGLTIELTNGRLVLPELEMVAKRIPSWRGRVHKATEHLVARERPEPDEETRKSIVRLLRYIREWDASSEGIAARNRVQAVVETRLPRRIDVARLRRSPADLFEECRKSGGGNGREQPQP